MLDTIPTSAEILAQPEDDAPWYLDDADGGTFYATYESALQAARERVSDIVTEAVIYRRYAVACSLGVLRDPKIAINE